MGREEGIHAHAEAVAHGEDEHEWADVFGLDLDGATREVSSACCLASQDAVDLAPGSFHGSESSIL